MFLVTNCYQLVTVIVTLYFTTFCSIKKSRPGISEAG